MEAFIESVTATFFLISNSIPHREWGRNLADCSFILSLNSRPSIKLAQHTTPIANTHGTAMLFASEPTENQQMLINVRHRNITNHDQNITTRHWDTKALPTQSRDITNTKPRHHPHITKTSQRNHYTSPRHAQDITNTSLKDRQNITSTCRKHLDTPPKNHWNISEVSPNHPWNTNKT